MPDATVTCEPIALATASQGAVALSVPAPALSVQAASQGALTATITVPCPPIGAPPAGALDEHTVLMLHMDGADEATTFMDSSASEHTVTASGGAQIDTAQKVFGSASGIFDGAGDYLAIPDSDDWTFGSDDFTIDFRINFSSLPSVGSPYQNIIGQYVDSGNEWRLFAERSSLTGLVKIKAWFKYQGAWLLSMVSEGSISEANSWYHIAFIRNVNNFDIYINGIQIGIPVVVSPTMPNYASDLIVGKRINDLYFNGWIDELRISKGVARWTENFTPPDAPYGAGSSGGVSLTVSLAVAIASPALAVATVPSCAPGLAVPASPIAAASALSTAGAIGTAIPCPPISLSSSFDASILAVSSGERRHTFDGLIDFQSDLWGTAIAMAKTARGILVASGGKYRVVIDKAATPVMAFTEGNNCKVRMDIIPRRDRANVITASFLDANQNYAQRDITEEDIAAGEYPIVYPMGVVVGVTREAHLRRLMRYMLLVNRYVTRVVTLEAGMDAAALEVGDVFYLQSPVADDALGGRIKEVSGANVVLDRPVVTTGTYNLYIWGASAIYSSLSQALTAGATEVAAPTGFTQSTPYEYPYMLCLTSWERTTYRALAVQRSATTMHTTITGIEYADEVYADD